MGKNLPFSKEQIAQANSIDLIQLAKSQGYILENGGRRAFHAKQSGGPIDFVMQFLHMNFKEAVACLLGTERPEHRPSPSPAPRERDQLHLPEKASNYCRAAWYLMQIRGIEPEIVSRLMHEKKLYQQDKTGNCVFVGYDEEGVAKYCSMRGTTPERPFKQDREHSDKSYPFHIAGTSTRLYVCESPIDAMSQANIIKIKGLDWTVDHYISLGGLSDQALERFLQQNHITEIIFCLDNDHHATYYDGSPAPNWDKRQPFRLPKNTEA